MWDFLLNGVTLAVAAVLLLAAVAALIIGRKRNSPALKAFLIVALAVLVAYFVFVLVAAVMAGSNPPRDPTPQGGSATLLAGVTV